MSSYEDKFKPRSIEQLLSDNQCSLKELYDNRWSYTERKDKTIWWVQSKELDLISLVYSYETSTSEPLTILKSILTKDDKPYELITLFNFENNNELSQHYKYFYYGNYYDVMERDVSDYLIDDFEDPCNDASGCFKLLMACDHRKLDELLHEAFDELMNDLSVSIESTLNKLEQAKTPDEFKEIINDYSPNTLYEVDRFDYKSSGFVFKTQDEAQEIIDMIRPIHQYETDHNLTILSELRRSDLDLSNIYVLHYWHKLTGSYDDFESIIIHFDGKEYDEYNFSNDDE